MPPGLMEFLGKIAEKAFSSSFEEKIMKIGSEKLRPIMTFNIIFTSRPIPFFLLIALGSLWLKNYSVAVLLSSFYFGLLILCGLMVISITLIENYKERSKNDQKIIRKQTSKA